MSKKLLKNGNLYGIGIRDILVENGRILAVEEGLSAEAEVIDLTGKTVLPGFFNAHVHLYGVEGPLPDELIKSFVQGGCTTVRDMGDDLRTVVRGVYELAVRPQGAGVSPRHYQRKIISGENTYGAVHPSGVKVGYVIDMTPEAAAAAVDAMVDAGADQIKTGLDYGMDPSTRWTICPRRFSARSAHARRSAASGPPPISPRRITSSMRPCGA